jgi:hypothetical protein
VVVILERVRNAAAAVFLVLLVAVIALSVVTRNPWPANDGVLLVLLAASAAVGYVIARAQPRNPIGWIFLALGLVAIFDMLVSLYLVLDFRQHGGRLPFGTAAVIWRDSFGVFPFILVMPAILLFPDGRLSGRWPRLMRVYVWAGALFMLGQYAGFALDPGEALGHVDLRGNTPSNSGGWVVWAPWLVLIPFFLCCWIGFVVHQINAWRRSSGVQRAQLKWLAFGGPVCLVSCVVVVVFGNDLSTISRVIGDLAVVGIAALPVSFGVAILRYRLYEIDRLISRTLAYALLTALLVGTFAGIVLLTTRVLPFSSPVAVAASTLAAAALFNPLRTRVQRLVDRRFNRARYDRDALVAAFGAKLRDAVDSETVLAELAGAASDAVEPMHVSVWVAN